MAGYPRKRIPGDKKVALHNDHDATELCNWPDSLSFGGNHNNSTIITIIFIRL